MNRKMCSTLLLLALAGCQPATSDASNDPTADSDQAVSAVHPTELTGRWDSVRLYVELRTANGSDSTAVTDADPSNYEEVVGLRTATAYFESDGTYREEYIALDGSVAYETSGYWLTKGDTIVVAQYEPLLNQAVYRYHYTLDGDEAHFESVMDYDGDGEEDDIFRGTSVRVSGTAGN